MENNEIIIASIISLITGIVSSWIFWSYRRGREKKIKQKIVNLEYKEKLIDSISNGYQNLLRHVFKSLTISLFLVFGSITAILAVKVFPVPAFIIYTVWALSISMFAVATSVCLSTYNEIVSLSDIKQAKLKINKQKEKLESKL